MAKRHIKKSENFVNGYLTCRMDCTEIRGQHSDNHYIELRSVIFGKIGNFGGEIWAISGSWHEIDAVIVAKSMYFVVYNRL